LLAFLFKKLAFFFYKTLQGLLGEQMLNNLLKAEVDFIYFKRFKS